MKLKKRIQTMARFQLTSVFLPNWISPGVIAIGNTSTWLIFSFGRQCANNKICQLLNSDLNTLKSNKMSYS